MLQREIETKLERLEKDALGTVQNTISFDVARYVMITFTKNCELIPRVVIFLDRSKFSMRCSS